MWLRMLSIATVLASGCADPTTDVEASCAAAGGSFETRAEHSRASLASGVAIFSRSSDRWSRCSGVLVGPQTVLTAGHCLHEGGGWRVEVYASPDLLTPDAPYTVASSRVHPTQDLGVVFLEEPVTGAAPLLRWSGDDVVSRYDDRVTVTGYGGPDGDISMCLRVTQRAQDVATYEASRWIVLLDGTAYPGDSGGPMVLDDAGPVLVGIHSGTTAGEVTQGSLSFLERLRRDDPWLVDVMGPATTLSGGS